MVLLWRLGRGKPTGRPTAARRTTRSPVRSSVAVKGRPSVRFLPRFLPRSLPQHCASGFPIFWPASTAPPVNEIRSKRPRYHPGRSAFWRQKSQFPRDLPSYKCQVVSLLLLSINAGSRYLVTRLIWPWKPPKEEMALDPAGGRSIRALEAAGGSRGKGVRQPSRRRTRGRSRVGGWAADAAARDLEEGV